MKAKLTMLAVALTLGVMTLTPLAAAHLTVGVADPFGVSAGGTLNNSAHPETSDGTGDPCRGGGLTGSDCTEYDGISGRYVTAGALVMADQFPLGGRASTLIGSPFPIPVNQCVVSGRVTGTCTPSSPDFIGSLDPGVFLCPGFGAGTSPKAVGSCSVNAGTLCDAEWGSAGDDPSNEPIVEGDTLETDGGNSGATAVVFHDGTFDDGGGGSVCNVDNAQPLWNTLGCSSVVYGNDMAIGRHVWIGAFCDSVTSAGGFSIDDCLVNQGVLGANGLMGVTGSPGVPAVVTAATTISGCVTTEASILLGAASGNYDMCAATGARDGTDSAIFGQGYHGTGTYGNTAANAAVLGTATAPAVLSDSDDAFGNPDGHTDGPCTASALEQAAPYGIADATSTTPNGVELPAVQGWLSGDSAANWAGASATQHDPHI